jgi:hypothetical protein
VHREREIFQRLNFLLTGEPALEAILALQQIYAASLCTVSGSMAEALQLAESGLLDVRDIIIRNFDQHKATARLMAQSTQ